MTERPGHCPEITMFDLLRTLYYADANNCNLDNFIFPPSIRNSDFGPIYITRIDTKTFIPPRAGFFNVSFDYVGQLTNATIVDSSGGTIDKPQPFLPFYRVFVARRKGEKPIKNFRVDETFEPSAKAIHDKLKEKIIEAKKAQGKEAYDEVTRMLQHPQVKF